MKDNASPPPPLAPEPENVCVCFHVPLGKLRKFLRLEEPKAASQLSECYGAGTGCGWCIPFLEQLFERHRAGSAEVQSLGLSAEEYLRRRREYLGRINARRMVEIEAELAEFSDRIDP